MRILIVPGLHDSGPAHWQTWLEAHWRDAVRVRQDDWTRPDLGRWARRIAETIGRDPQARWVAVAHSFGCLALAHHVAQHPDGAIAAALLVAPADPQRFGIAEALPQRALGIPAVLLASDTDPWMSAGNAALWARRWQARHASLGDAGHVNVDSGHGPLPEALALTRELMRHAGARVAESA